MSIPSEQITSGVLINELVPLNENGSDLLMSRDLLALYHTNAFDGDSKADTTVKIPISQIIRKIDITIENDSLVATWYNPNNLKIKPITSLNQNTPIDDNFVLPIKNGGTGTSDEEGLFLKRTTDIFTGNLTLNGGFTVQNSNTTKTVAQIASSHIADLQVASSTAACNLSANQENIGLYDDTNQKWILKKNVIEAGSEIGAATTLYGTATESKAVRDLQAVMYTENDGTYKYRMFLTGLGNLRIERSTDGGQTYQKFSYAATRNVQNGTTMPLAIEQGGTGQSTKENVIKSLFDIRANNSAVSSKNQYILGRTSDGDGVWYTASDLRSWAGGIGSASSQSLNLSSVNSTASFASKGTGLIIVYGRPGGGGYQSFSIPYNALKTSAASATPFLLSEPEYYIKGDIWRSGTTIYVKLTAKTLNNSAANISSIYNYI